MNRASHLIKVLPLISAAALITLPLFGSVPVSAETRPPAATVRLAHLPLARLADQLSGRLGPQHAGSFVDGNGDLVVNVTNAAAAHKVRAAGAKPRVVEHGITPLTDAKKELDRLAGSPGTIGLSWGIDVMSNTVVVSVPENDTNDATDAFVKRARAIGPVVRFKRVPAAPRLQLGPGDAILTGSSRCSVAAIGVGGGTEYVVTAGHCTNNGAEWRTRDGQLVGTRQASSFPGNDYGTIRSAGQVPLDNAQLTQVGRPPAGTQIQKKGSTTGTTSGRLVGYGRTVNYREGAVTDMIETTACTQPGDSGGSLQSGTTAVGIVSGGTTGSCRANYQSFFQPLDEALQSQGLTLK
ncbi:S1 family peptidase [Actinomadura spongiicola]|uniref:S1 family peptidase n=1 Tax=Actinomadura spongiicola TaxID=2303421 RepID=UPI0013141795|nr:S1 family peptidase [Actinomadura spongiicola]